MDRRVINDMKQFDNCGVKEVEGRKYLTIDGEITNATGIMTKSAFIEQFIISFTLGYIGEKSYFDYKGWSDVSDEGHTGVCIVADDNPQEVLFIIPALTDQNLSPSDAVALATAGMHMSHATGAVEMTRATQILEEGMGYIAEKVPFQPRSFHSLIPTWLYEELKIVPEVYRQMILCRDRYGLEPNTEAWKVAEACFLTMHNGVKLKPEQVQFIDTLTQNEFQYPEGLADAKIESSLDQPYMELNPNEC